MATKKSTGKKTTARKKAPARRASTSRAPRIEKMTGGVVVGGNINAQRDVVMGNQTNITDNRIAHISTPREFVAELEKLRAQIAALKHSPDLDAGDQQTVQIIEGRVSDAATEASKPEPDGNKVVALLDKAGKTMTALGAGVTTAIGLGETLGKIGPYLGQAVEAARRLFGG